MEIAEHKPRRTLISLTPLIDVVFILLVFFMLVSSFSEWKAIPLVVGEAEPLLMNEKKQSLIVVDFGQKYSLNDRAMVLDEIVKNVSTRIKQHSDHPVLIQPVSDLPLQNLVQVLDALSEVAGPNMSLVKAGNNGH